jgi:(2Fe-2S) ferredoxin
MAWIRNLIDQFRRTASIPPPPWRASKRVAKIKNGVWYGRLSPTQAREMAREWGFAEADIEQMIDSATEPPSYWSKHPH